jgi:hypothetical protein
VTETPVAPGGGLGGPATVVDVEVELDAGLEVGGATDDPFTGSSSRIGSTGRESVPSSNPAAANVTRPAATPIARTATARHSSLTDRIVPAADESDMRHR